jgi:hypothetical protein
MPSPEVFVRSLSHQEAVRLKRLSTRAKHQSVRIRACAPRGTLLDGRADRIRARAAWRLRRAQDAAALRSARGISSPATSGGTSTDPYRAQGRRAACPTAWSRSAQSSR